MHGLAEWAESTFVSGGRTQWASVKLKVADPPNAGLGQTVGRKLVEGRNGR